MFKRDILNAKVLYKLRSSDVDGQSSILEAIRSNINIMGSQELQLLLEFINAITDTELEVKLFSLLAVCLASNDSHYETIVTYNPLYEKIEGILSRALPLKATIILNFITALLVNDDAEGGFSKRKKLAMHARNLIRVSGCLSGMTGLFVNGMMFPDTWRALCRCLAECCRDNQLNKIHCANLIPLCVQKSLQGVTDVIMVLHSILRDHPKNINIFVNCNGVKIFNRALLQNATCLQLLCTVLKGSKEVGALIHTTSTPKYVTEILHWNGPHSEKGQWCTIAMYYLNLSSQAIDANKKCDTSPEKDETTEYAIPRNVSVNTEHSDGEQTIGTNVNSVHDDDDTEIEQMNENKVFNNDDTNKLFSNVVKEILYWKSKDDANDRFKTEILRPRAEEISQTDLPREFSALFSQKENSGFPKMRAENIANPFLNVNVTKTKNIQRKKPFTGGSSTLLLQEKPQLSALPTLNKNKRSYSNSKIMISPEDQDRRPECSKLVLTKEKRSFMKPSQDRTKPSSSNDRRGACQTEAENDMELSFSFLQKMTDSSKKDINCRTEQCSEGRGLSGVSSDVNRGNTFNGTSKTKLIADKSVQTNFESTERVATPLVENANNVTNSTTLEDFKPFITSTPKSKNRGQCGLLQKKASGLKGNMVKKAYSYSQSRVCKKRGISNKKSQRKPSQPIKTSKSMSARFFNAINESCTTIVKTVKDVFMPWKKSTSQSNESTSASKLKAPVSSNYSFMQYMKKRDAILRKDSLNNGHSCNTDNFTAEMDWNPCKTCNDTAILKQKLASNEYLYKTVRKLKLGINLFGCDFKKISRTFWPHETYMTATVLYALYRKLILK